MNSIDIRQAAVYRGNKRVLKIDSLAVASGELVCILGPNGSGKSTLLQVLNGLLPVQEGEVRILGQELATADQVRLRRQSALVFQDPLFIHDTVYHNVALPLHFRGLPDKVIRDRTEAAMEAFRCSHLAARLAHRLSGGEAQRVCLARAFVTDPELVLLDEPFSALDPATRNVLLAELKAAAQARRTTVLLVSHNLDEVLRFAKRAVVMQDGIVVQDSSPEEILRRPVNMTIARLAGMDNIWPVRLQSTTADGPACLAGTVTFPVPQPKAEGQAWCCLPGDSFRLINNNLKLQPGWVKLEVDIIQVVAAIGTVQVEGQAGPLPVILRLTPSEAAAVSCGERVSVAFSPEAAHILTA